MELRWVNTLREHGEAYTWCKSDLTLRKQWAHEELARTNPEAPYKVAELQGQIKLLDDLIHQLTAEERKEQFDVERERRKSTPGKLRTTRSA